MNAGKAGIAANADDDAGTQAAHQPHRPDYCSRQAGCRSGIVEGETAGDSSAGEKRHFESGRWHQATLQPSARTHEVDGVGRVAPLDEGAKLLLDGRNPQVKGSANAKSGHFIGPTIFNKVSPTMTIATEEIFGPVLCVIEAKTLDDAIAMAKSHPMANAASI